MLIDSKTDNKINISFFKHNLYKYEIVIKDLIHEVSPNIKILEKSKKTTWKDSNNEEDINFRY